MFSNAPRTNPFPFLEERAGRPSASVHKNILNRALEQGVIASVIMVGDESTPPPNPTALTPRLRGRLAHDVDKINPACDVHTE